MKNWYTLQILGGLPIGILIFTRAILIFWGNFVINSNFKGIHKNIHIFTFICFYVGLGSDNLKNIWIFSNFHWGWIFDSFPFWSCKWPLLFMIFILENPYQSSFTRCLGQFTPQLIDNKMKNYFAVFYL